MNTYHDTIDDFLETSPRSGRRGKQFSYWGILCVLVSAVLFLINTRRGIGIFVDSTRYMGISETPYDAPLYPWMLKFGAASGFSKAIVAKFIGLVLVCANTFLIWQLLSRATGRYAYALVGAFLIILAPQFVSLHAIAMSEPPFLFLVLLTIFGFLRFLESESTAWLLASALALGLATLARFTAPPLGAAIALCILINPHFPLKRRISDAGLFAVASAAIFLFWALVSHIVAGRTIGRELWIYGNMGPREWLTSLEALTAWMLPDQVPFGIRAVLFVAFASVAAVLTVMHARKTLQSARKVKQVDTLLPLMLGLFILFYFVFVILSTALEANLSLNSRYAFPAYVATVLMMTIVVADLGSEGGAGRWLHHALVALAIVVLASHAARTVIRSAEAYQSGIGYASQAWTNSPTIIAIEKLPADAALYSNGADAITYILQRPASFIPERIELRTDRENPNAPLELQMQQLREKLARSPSYVVFFDKVDWRFYLISEDELVQRLSLEKIAEEADGRIYAMPGSIVSR